MSPRAPVDRVSRQLRLPRDLDERVVAAAAERGVSVQKAIEAACALWCAGAEGGEPAGLPQVVVSTNGNEGTPGAPPPASRPPGWSGSAQTVADRRDVTPRFKGGGKK